MTLSLTHEHMNDLKTRLRVPVLIERWLKDEHSFHAADEYVVHEKLADMHPEQALLCIALSLDLFVKGPSLDQIVLAPLKQLVGHLIREYGPRAVLINQKDSSVDQDSDIPQVAHDLQILKEALEIAEPTIPYKRYNPLNKIYSALLIQTGAQLEIARFVLHNLPKSDVPKPKDLSGIPLQVKIAAANDNNTTVL